MIPTTRLLRLVSAWFLLGVCASVWERFVLVWQGFGGLLGLAVVLDALGAFFSKSIRVERRLPGRLALGVAQEIQLTLHNPNTHPLTVEFFDGLPATVEKRVSTIWGFGDGQEFGRRCGSGFKGRGRLRPQPGLLWFRWQF